MTNMNGRKRAILYARVSTKQQEEHGYRLTKQFDDMRDYAARNNFDVISEFQEAYTGTVPFRNRPYGAKVYEAIEAGKVDAVVWAWLESLLTNPQKMLKGATLT